MYDVNTISGRIKQDIWDYCRGKLNESWQEPFDNKKVNETTSGIVNGLLDTLDGLHKVWMENAAPDEVKNDYIGIAKALIEKADLMLKRHNLTLSAVIQAQTSQLNADRAEAEC